MREVDWQKLLDALGTALEAVPLPDAEDLDPANYRELTRRAAVRKKLLDLQMLAIQQLSPPPRQRPG